MTVLFRASSPARFTQRVCCVGCFFSLFDARTWDERGKETNETDSISFRFASSTVSITCVR